MAPVPADLVLVGLGGRPTKRLWCAVPHRRPLGESAERLPHDDLTIRQLEEQERLGVLNRDTDVLERIWAEEFMVNSPLNTISPTRAAVLDLVRQGMIRYSSFDRRIEQLRMLGNLAIVMGSETVQPVAEPPAPPVQRRFTHVWRNEAGSWRLVARHANNVTP